MPKPASEAAAAVAVVSAGTRELLRDTLVSLEPAHAAGVAEVWVVDNASTDGSPEMVRDDFPWVTLVALDENVGYGRAINLVAERTRTPWVVASNSDIRAEPGALELMLAAGEADARLGAVTPRLVQPDGETQHSVFPLPTVPLTIAFNSGIAYASKRVADRLCIEGFWNPDRRREVPWAIAAFLLLRRSAFEEVGGFDEEQWIYAEDLDLGWRLHDGGWRTLHEPAAVVHHRVSASTTAAFGETREERWLAATYACILRRRGGLRTRVIAAANVAGAAVRWAYSGLRARLGSAKHAEQSPREWYWAALHRRGLRSSKAILSAAPTGGRAASGPAPSSRAAGSG